MKWMRTNVVGLTIFTGAVALVIAVALISTISTDTKHLTVYKPPDVVRNAAPASTSWFESTNSNASITIRATNSDASIPIGAVELKSDTGYDQTLQLSGGSVTFLNLPAGAYTSYTNGSRLFNPGVIPPANSVWGQCGYSVPPAGDPCYGVSGTLQYAFWVNVVNAQTYKNWAKANPGEVTRLKAYLAAPSINPPVMKTILGTSLTDIVQAYAYAYGKPMTLPAANPKVTASIPTPSNLQVTNP